MKGRPLTSAYSTHRSILLTKSTTSLTVQDLTSTAPGVHESAAQVNRQAMGSDDEEENFGVGSRFSALRGLVCDSNGAGNDGTDGAREGGDLPFSACALRMSARSRPAISLVSTAGDFKPKRSRKPDPATGSRWGRLAIEALRSSGLDEASEAVSADLLVDATDELLVLPLKYDSSCWAFWALADRTILSRACVELMSIMGKPGRPAGSPAGFKPPIRAGRESGIVGLSDFLLPEPLAAAAAAAATAAAASKSFLAAAAATAGPSGPRGRLSKGKALAAEALYELKRESMAAATGI